MKKLFIDLCSIEAILPTKQRSAGRFVYFDTIFFIVLNKLSGFSLYCLLTDKGPGYDTAIVGDDFCLAGDKILPTKRL